MQSKRTDAFALFTQGKASLQCDSHLARVAKEKKVSVRDVCVCVFVFGQRQPLQRCRAMLLQLWGCAAGLTYVDYNAGTSHGASLENKASLGR